jgi:hypothetical protein
MRPRLLLLSPHSDDIAFSLGGLLAAGSAFRGWERHQVTLFVRSCHAPYAPQLDSVAAVTRARCQEDDAFCAYHGIRLHRLDLEETLVRGYPSVASIFALRRPEDDPLFERTCHEVARAVDGFDLVLSPLGIGGHIEHALVREACRRTRADVLYYEDLPYAGDYSNAELDRAGAGFALEMRCRSFDIEAALVSKCDRLLAYASQVQAADLTKVIDHARRRRPSPDLLWPIAAVPAPSPRGVEVLWGRPELLALADGVAGAA